MKLRAAVLLFLSALVFSLSGCGSAPPPQRSAKSQIQEAESAIETAKVMLRGNHLDQALAEFNTAKDKIASGKAFAAGTELTTLRGLEKDVRMQIVEIENKKLMGSIAAKPKDVAVAAAPQAVDPETAKKLLEDKEKKRLEIEAEKNKELLAVGPKKVKEAKDEEPDAKAPAAAEGEAKIAAKPKSDIYPDADDKSPGVQIAKLVTKSKGVIAYFQLNNHTDNGRRIMSVTAFFKDNDNQIVINPGSTAVFRYTGFNAGKADLMDQSVNAVTQGSDTVDGNSTVQLVAVGESDKPDKISKVTIKVIYSDNTSEFETGPTAAAGGGGLLK